MTKPKQQKITAAVFLEVASEMDLIPIFPAGVSTGRDGRGPYVLLDAAKVIANSKLNNVELVIDRDHAADLLPPGQERRAAGWIKQLVEKDGAIFAQVEWTPRGKADLEGKEYRYISPTFNFDIDTREVLQILRATLTNTPNFDMKAVASEGADDNPAQTSEQKETPDMDKYKLFITAIASALALASTATPEEVEAAALARFDVAKATEAELASIRTGLKLEATATASSIIATATASAQPDPEKYVPMEAHQAVVAELASIQKGSSADAVEAAMKAGKIAPAQKAWALAYASSNPKGFAEYVAGAPVLVNASEQLKGQAKETATTLTTEETEICSQLNISSEEFLKSKASD